MNMQIRDFLVLQMENKCPNSFCTFVYKVKKKPFKCDSCSSYIGTIYHYRTCEIMYLPYSNWFCRCEFIILNLMNIFIYKFIFKYTKYHVNKYSEMFCKHWVKILNFEYQICVLQGELINRPTRRKKVPIKS